MDAGLAEPLRRVSRKGGSESPSCPKTRSTARSGRATVVVIQQATETLASKHRNVRVGRWRSTREQHVGETLMVALAVVVDKVFSDGPAKVSFAERDDPIEAFAP